MCDDEVDSHLREQYTKLVSAARHINRDSGIYAISPVSLDLIPLCTAKISFGKSRCHLSTSNFERICYGRSMPQLPQRLRDVLLLIFLLIIYCAAVSVVIADSTRLQRSLASYYINTCNSLLVN